VLRFLLGVAEAGFLPGMIFYLSLWFPERKMAAMMSWVLIAAPMAGVANGIVSGFIMTGMDGAWGFRGWQWLFLLTWLPSVLIGIIAVFRLSDTPAEASWLSAEEKALICAKPKSFPVDARQQIAGLFRHPAFYALLFSNFMLLLSLSLISLWQPTLLKAIAGQTIRSVSWEAGAIALVGAIGVMILGYLSDFLKDRRIPILACAIFSCLSLILVPHANASLAATFGLLCVASVSIYGNFMLFWTLCRGYLHENVRAVGVATVNALGYTASFFAPVFIGWMKVATGSFGFSFAVIGILQLAGVLVLLTVFGKDGARWGQKILSASPTKIEATA
jgi:sugar phosphate permease